MVSEKGALLEYAISKLRPGVFSHPVWVRFSNKDKTVPSKTIQDLFSEAEQLRRDNPSDACQVLLICAVYQNYSGQRARALRTIQKALELAERTRLPQEVLWATWGACAVCVQQGNYGQAVIHFGRLQAALKEQNEWMLANYIDVVKQFFLSPATAGREDYSTSPQSQSCGNLLTSTFDWLYRWGFSAQSDPGAPFDRQIHDVSSQTLITASLSSAGRQQGPWHALKLMFRGELNLHWMKSASPGTERHCSFWESILSLLHLDPAGRKMDAEMIEADLQIPTAATSQTAADELRSSHSAPKPNRQVRKKSIQVDQNLEKRVVALPVSVYMLGRFVMNILDRALELPASRSRSLLQYVLLNHKQNVPREVLMDVFWPDAGPETARNNLNVAIHSIRKALRPLIDLPVVLYKDGAYRITPDVQMWLDVEEFERLVTVGQRLELRNPSAAVSEYEAAISIYQGDFLEENPYESWAVLTRESLRMAYLKTLDSLSRIYFSQERYAACIRVCQLLLVRDRCREDAHCMLMRCYNHQGQDHLALRQYQACVEALRLELDVAPAPSTTQLFQQIRQHRRV